MSDIHDHVAVSIVVAAYNSAQTVRDTVASVLAQTRDDWELIVVDDGSTDGTSEVLRQLASQGSRIRVLSQTNTGTAGARNAGAALAAGEYVVFLDADDLLLPEYLGCQLEFARAHPGYDIYACNAEMLLGDGRNRLFWSDARHCRTFSLSAQEQILESSILLMAMITRRTLELTGGFRSLHSEDYDFWLRALLLGATHIYNPGVLAVYRRHEGQRTRSLVAEAESFLRIQREALEMPRITEPQRAALEEAIAFSEARVGRRQLEEKLLDGDYTHARSIYWRYRRAFPDALKYLTGLAIMLVSPRLYARIKSSRML